MPHQRPHRPCRPRRLAPALALLLLGSTPAAAQQVALRVELGPPAASVRAAGDVDADGVPDLLWGTHFTAGTDTRVISGASGQVLHDLNGPGYHGVSYGAGGDVDGDGHDDFMVSDGLGLGSVPTVYSGASGAILFSFPSALGNAGAGMLIVPDVDGDGLDEMVLGAPLHPLPDANGRVRVRSGADGAVLLELDAQPGHHGFGSALASAGDVDGDGLCDLVVGVSQGGPIQVFALPRGELLLSLPNTDFQDHFGSQVGSVGDVDGDGVPEIFVGGSEVNAGGSAVGRVTLFDGATGAPLWTATGAPGDFFARAVRAVDDLDGDGVRELAVGVPRAKFPGADCAGSHVRLLSGASGVELLRILGDDVGTCVGLRLAAPGDLNGDGVPELALPAQEEMLLVSVTDLALAADVHAVSLAAGGVQTLALDAGALHAGDDYLLLGSFTGIAPGFALAGQHVPLNPDPYLVLSVQKAGSPPFVGSAGVLDATGGAGAQLVVPASAPAELAGLVLQHAFVVRDAASGVMTLASNSVPLVLTP